MRVFSTGWSNGFDGPGRRWVIYLKGCNLSCKWCANPESISPQTQMMFYPSRSINCAKACEYGAVELENGSYKLNRDICGNCADKPCVNKWHNKAFEIAGYDISPKQILEQAKRFENFLNNKAITFGGGEPTVQLDELVEAAKLLKEQGYHLAIETNCCCDEFEKVVDLFDLVIADIKCIGDDLAIDWLGRSVSEVVENVKMAALAKCRLIVRVPIVREFNDTQEQMDLICRLLEELAQSDEKLKVEIMRMHHSGQPKYEALDMDYELKNLQPPSIEQAENFVRRLVDFNVDARLVS